MNNWTSHLGQDAWVALCLGGKRDGYFLDIGAFDGLTHSNSYVLENNFGWHGICVEPNPTAYVQLCRHRRAICVPAAAVADGPERLLLVEAHGLSSLKIWADKDRNAELRAKAMSRTVVVRTVKPGLLLDHYDAPARIDYLSLDVEGPEVEIVQSLIHCGNPRGIALATIEHNCDEPKRQRIREVMGRAGYSVVEGHARHDDFFWMPGLLPFGVNPQAIFDHVQKMMFP